ncbi:MAG: GNAT family N-acetyltransferase, partial [Armatimonadota bacterium]
MLATLETVALRGGATMTIRMFEPPEEDTARRLVYFLRHKDDDSLRGIRQRVLGQYADHCLDRYFIGEVENEIIGHAWYGLPRVGQVCNLPGGEGKLQTCPTREGVIGGIGNFGHVYTNPEWRGQGVAREITRVLVDHFNAEPTGGCLLCTASAESGHLYQKFGFRFIPPTAQSGPMGLLKPSVAGGFAELDEAYFAPGQPVTVREGHIGHRHDLDRMLDFSAPWLEARQHWHFVALASRVPTFISALHYVEDGRGLLNVLQTDTGSVVGYAFALNLGSRFEQGLRTFDFVVHPHYLEQANVLLEGTLRRAGAPVYAFVAECDAAKLTALLAAGFVEHCRLPRAFHLAGEPHDVVLLR